MKLQAVVHEAEEGEFCAEVPTIPSCVTQAETMEELLANLHKAVEACLSADVAGIVLSKTDRILEIAV